MNADQLLLRPVIVGTNHRTGALGLRDLLFVEDESQPAFLAGLRAAGLPQAMALSTCDRVEVLAMHADAVAVERAVTRIFAERAGMPAEDLAGQLYLHADMEAVRHCFAVAASLDSQVIGEPHVLGQVRASHRFARQAGMCGAELDTLLSGAYGAAKRVRSETTVAERPVSIAAAALQIARDLHGDLAETDALLLGTGEMGELVAESLLAAHLRRFSVAAPRPGRAAAVAEALGGRCEPFEDLPRLLAEADIVITALGGRRPLLTSGHILLALRQRRRKPIFLVDLGLPADVDTAVNRVDGAYLYDLADLERIALAGRAGRERAAQDAWTIIESETAAFMQGQAARAAVPAITALRRHFEAVRDETLREAGDDAGRASRLLVNRLLHEPSEAMRHLAAGATAEEWAEAERLLRRLFRLE